MDVTVLLLKKEEIPIIGKTSFYVPIHPSLLTRKLDPELAHVVFPQALEEWIADMEMLLPGMEDSEQLRRVYLSKKPKIVKRAGVQRINSIGWEDDVRTANNGFADFLCISRNGGGTLFYDQHDLDCEYPLFENSRFIRFSREKIEDYKIPGRSQKKCFRYTHHNIDYFPGALFLRNWSLLYLNAALQS
jgi:hypothetical protein